MPPGTRSASARTAPSAPPTTPARCARSASPAELGGPWGGGVSRCCGEPQPLSLLPLPFSRCPSGQVKIAPCTPHSDLLCGPPTGSFSGSYSKFGAAGGTGARAGDVGAAASTCPVLPVIVIVIIVALAAVLLLLLLWKRCCRHPAAGEGGPGVLTPKWGLWVGRGTSPGADGSAFPSRGQQRPGQKVWQRGGESWWGLCSLLALLAAPREGWGSVQGAVAKQSGGLLRPPPPRGLVSPPRLGAGVSSSAALCFSPPSTTWCCS